jgi:hypothetical protein
VSEPLVLEPGERRVLAVRFEVPAQIFAAHACEFVFETPTSERVRLEATLWPDPSLMRAETLHDFSHAEENTAETRALLTQGTRADEEPALRPDGRWLVSDGVSVRETTSPDGAAEWSFAIARFPAEPLRPAMAELPLPSDFAFPENTLLEFSHRFTCRDEPDSEAWFDVYFRTANGNLFQTWPRLRTGEAWRGYAAAAQNFTMAFYGRAALPWRFGENRPAALVFFFRPEKLPAVFTVRGAVVTRRVVR